MGKYDVRDQKMLLRLGIPQTRHVYTLHAKPNIQLPRFSLTAEIGQNTFDRLERDVSGAGEKDRQLDSLDANILNVDQEKDRSGVASEDEKYGRGIASDEDVGYSASHFSGGDSTIRVGSTITKMMVAPGTGIILTRPVLIKFHFCVIRLFHLLTKVKGK